MNIKLKPAAAMMVRNVETSQSADGPLTIRLELVATRNVMHNFPGGGFGTCTAEQLALWLQSHHSDPLVQATAQSELNKKTEK